MKDGKKAEEITSNRVQILSRLLADGLDAGQVRKLKAEICAETGLSERTVRRHALGSMTLLVSIPFIFLQPRQDRFFLGVQFGDDVNGWVRNPPAPCTYERFCGQSAGDSKSRRARTP